MLWFLRNSFFESSTISKGEDQIMPVVSLYYKPNRIPDEVVSKLAKALPEIIACALDVPERIDSRLTAEDIEIRVTSSHPFDVNNKDLEIMIWAHQYLERLQNLEDRKEKILVGVRRFFADYDLNVIAWVWVLLQPTAFGRI